MSEEKIPRFGATDFYLLDADPAAVRSELKGIVASYLGYEPAESDPLFVVCMALMPYIVQTRALSDACAKSSLLSYAVGQNLDRIADATCAVGYLDRLPARPAFCPVEVNLTPALPEPSASAPSRVEWSGSVSFEANGRRYDSGEVHGECVLDSYVEAGVTRYYYRGSLAVLHGFCSEPGRAGNISRAEADAMALAAIAAAGLSMQVGSSSAVSGLPVTVYGAAGGAEAENDGAFAERIRTRQTALRIPGSVAYYSDLLNTVYGLRDFYIPKKALVARPTWESDAPFDGAVQVYYVGETPAGAPSAYNPPAPDSPDLLPVRMKNILTASKLVSDKIMIDPAIAHVPLTARLSVHFSMPSGSTAEQVARVEAAYAAALDKCCYRIGIVVNFDEFNASLVAAGAFDSKVIYGDHERANYELYENEYLGASAFELIRDPDTDPVDIVNPVHNFLNAELIV